MIRDFVKGIVIANEQEMVNPLGVPMASWKVLYKGNDENIGAIGCFVNGFEVALNITATQPI